jgi:bleomycin hydrolase
MKKIISFYVVFLFSLPLFAQQPQKDKAIFLESKPGFYQNSILKDIRALDEAKEPAKSEKRFHLDFTGMDLPNKVSLYRQEWHNTPVSQGNTGTCWCFSTTSFFESEVYRLTGQKVKLSEMYTVYWEYVEKAKRYIRERGNSVFSEGSEANAVIRDYTLYGIVPEESYPGIETGRQYHNHAKMAEEMHSYLLSLKSSNAWNETEAVATIREIMNHTMGEPPSTFTWNGKTMTPQDFLKDVLKLKMDDYVDILSVMQKPYWEQVEYEVTDNWWHSKDYYNVPLSDYMNALHQCIANHFTVAIGGDVSEAGFDRTTQVAMIPTFDIPDAWIDENARQFRFSNGTTTDDHGVHVVGFLDKDGHTWYLIKDSSSGSRNNDPNAPEFGYYFFRDDYVKLKMMSFTVHRDAVKELLKKFPGR